MKDVETYDVSVDLIEDLKDYIESIVALLESNKDMIVEDKEYPLKKAINDGYNLLKELEAGDLEEER